MEHSNQTALNSYLVEREIQRIQRSFSGLTLSLRPQALIFLLCRLQCVDNVFPLMVAIQLQKYPPPYLHTTSKNRKERAAGIHFYSQISFHPRKDISQPFLKSHWLRLIHIPTHHLQGQLGKEVLLQHFQLLLQEKSSTRKIEASGECYFIGNQQCLPGLPQIIQLLGNQKLRGPCL